MKSGLIPTSETNDVASWMRSVGSAGIALWWRKAWLALWAPSEKGWGVDSGEQLCLACGLCCDGSLFDNVRLGPGDDAARLKELGLPVKLSRAKSPIAHVRQPCPALCGDRACRVYADRPTQCRSFECGVFKDLRAGKIGFDAALRSVRQARRKADKVRRLLRQLGDTEETLSLDKRFRRAQKRLEAGTGDEAAADAFAELGLAMHQLDLLAHRKFYTSAESS